MQARYINPYTDFGFKKIFGEEASKDLLIDFLNNILPKKHLIEDLTYTPTEQLGESILDRRAVFDLHCKTISGEFIIVEMQKTEQKFFKDRTLYYATFPIQRQAEKGKLWNFELAAIYTVGILDFTFSASTPGEVKHTVYLKDQHNAVFYDKLLFVYLEMPNFNKTIDELETDFDRWLFVLKNLATLQERPKALQQRVFEKLFRLAEIAQLPPQEQDSYEHSLKIYRDVVNAVNTSFDKGEQLGLEKGKIEGKIETAHEMLKLGLSVEVISKVTGFSIEEINSHLSK